MNFLSTMKIGNRLTVGFGVISLFMVIIAVVAITVASNIRKLVNETIDVSNRLKYAMGVTESVHGIAVDMAAIIVSKENSEKDKFKTAIDSHRAKYKSIMDTLSEKLVGEQKELLNVIQTEIKESKPMNEKTMESSYAGNQEEAAKAFLQKSLPAMNKIIDASGKLLNFQETDLNKAEVHSKMAFEKGFKLLTALIIIALIINILFAVLTTRSIVVPFLSVESHLKEVSDGNITKDVSADLVSRKDEVGILAAGLQTVIGNLRSIVSDLSKGIQTMASSSSGLSTIAKKLIEGANEMNNKASTVSNASEKMDSNTESMANGMEHANNSLSSVAIATEEMSATISDIASNAEKAREVSQEAMKQGENIVGVVKNLGVAAQDISTFTETINSISAQTNLLALNATIEAARAGAAGKGFAVVANEIKTLAEQTAAATGEINSKISGIQTATGSAIADIEQITKIVSNVGEIVTSIATAIEEQATVTKDIASNISQATDGVKDSNEKMSETAKVSRSVSENIMSVKNAIGEMMKVTDKVNSSSMDLSTMADKLNAIVKKFRV